MTFADYQLDAVTVDPPGIVSDHALSPLLGRDRDVAGSTDHTADSFAEFFDKKIRDVRSATAGLPPPPASRTASSSLASFRPCTQTEVRRIIMQSLVKSCTLDPVPTFLVREFVLPVAAIPDDDGQHVADAGPTPSVAEARDSDTASQEIWSRSD